MTKAVLFYLSYCSLAVFCCILHCVKLQPACFKGGRTVQTICSSPFHDTRGDGMGFISKIIFLMDHISTHVSAPDWCQQYAFLCMWVVIVHGNPHCGSYKLQPCAIIIHSAVCFQRRLCVAKTPSWRKVAPLKSYWFPLRWWWFQPPTTNSEWSWLILFVVLFIYPSY